jgi:hypothetical protein
MPVCMQHSYTDTQTLKIKGGKLFIYKIQLDKYFDLMLIMHTIKITYIRHIPTKGLR